MNSAKYFWLLLVLSLGLRMQAQNYAISSDIPVTVAGNSLSLAWAGGLTAPQFSAIDLDNDGRLDLMVFERDGESVLPLLNGGTAGQVDYTFAPQWISNFPASIHEWTLLRDFDQDGFMDIFTAIPQINGMRVYRNTSAAIGGTLSFSLYQDTVYSSYPPSLPLYSARSDMPAIDDLDGDGDLDFLTFQLSGTKVEWHRNVSVENTGGLGLIEYVRQSRCFGHFEEDVLGCTALIERVPCGTGERDADAELIGEKVALHSGSTILSLDLDNNGLQDLVIGDVGCSTLYGLYNAGTSQIAHFDSLELDYPAHDTAARVLLFPASYAVDVNNDGKKDLLVAPNKTGQAEDRLSVQYFENQGTTQVPDFKFQRYGLFQEEMIDMGTEAMPTFLDYNGDGLMDLLVGGGGRYDSLIGLNLHLQLYANTGSAQQPAFTLVSDDYLGIEANSAFANAGHLHPTAGDLDGDGDQDLLLGNVDGAIFHFSNTAGPGNPATFNLQTTNFAGIDVGLNSAPQLVDLDQDGDLDLLVGDHRGFVHYFQNTGSTTSATFTLVTDTLGAIKVNDFTGLPSSNGYSQPFACDYDGDSDMDLLVGGIEGLVHIYENITLAPGDSFPLTGNLIGFDFGNSASPAAAILDSARMSFVVGSRRGGLNLVRMSGPVGVAPAQAFEQPTIKLFPNPAQEVVSFEIVSPNGRKLDQYALYDAMGRLQDVGKITGRLGQIGLEGLSDGIYVLVFSGQGQSWSQRLVIRH